MHRLYGVEPNMSLRRTAVRSFFIFQKDRQNLNGLERFLSRVLQLQENPWFRIYESKSKRSVRIVVCAHKSSSEADVIIPAQAAAIEILFSRRAIKSLN